MPRSARRCWSTASAAGDQFYGKHNRLLTRYAQGAQAQEWLAHKTWGLNVKLMLNTQAAGCVVLVDYRATARVGRERMFTLTTFLLADNGRAYLDFSAVHHQGWQIWSSVYGIHLGAPLVTRWRAAAYFSAGVVSAAVRSWQGSRQPVRVIAGGQVSQAVAYARRTPRPVGDAEPAQWHRAAAPLAQRHRRPVRDVRIVAASHLLRVREGLVRRAITSMEPSNRSNRRSI